MERHGPPSIGGHGGEHTDVGGIALPHDKLACGHILRALWNERREGDADVGDVALEWTILGSGNHPVKFKRSRCDLVCADIAD